MTNVPPILTVHDLSVVFPDSNGGLHALNQVSFEVCPQEFICVLGASGSGKSTLLRVLAGLLAPTEGTVEFADGGQPRIGMVFQQSNLMPWRTAIENVALPETEFMKQYVGDPNDKLRCLFDPRNPLMSGVVQNQDAYMKGKIAQRHAYDKVAGAVQEAMDDIQF